MEKGLDQTEHGRRSDHFVLELDDRHGIDRSRTSFCIRPDSKARIVIANPDGLSL